MIISKIVAIVAGLISLAPRVWKELSDGVQTTFDYVFIGLIAWIMVAIISCFWPSGNTLEDD